MKYKNITIEEPTFKVIEVLQKSMFPGVRLSKIQTINKITSLATDHLLKTKGEENGPISPQDLFSKD